MRTLLLLLLPLFTFAQFDNIYYSGIEVVDIEDDLYIEPIQKGTIIATSLYYTTTKNEWQVNTLRGKIINSFESKSDIDAVIESNWKSDYIVRPGEFKKDALVRGENNKYYIIRWEYQQ